MKDEKGSTDFKMGSLSGFNGLVVYAGMKQIAEKLEE